MTGDGDRQFVFGARTGDGAHRLWGADTARNLGIRNCLADWNLPQCPPHPLLEGGAAHVKRKVQADLRFLYEGDDPRHQCFIISIAADEMRLWEAILEVTREALRIVSQ
jgi:hypothetical protein